MLLRGEARTVTELSEALGLTDNGVRLHLATLERDGLVRQSGERPGARKPHFVYELTAEAEEIFPKVYDLVLNNLLAVLTEKMGTGEVEELLREVGRRVAGPGEPASGEPVEARLDRALQAIEDIGGQGRIEKEAGKTFICGASCPLTAVAKDHAGVCGMLAEVLSSIVGVPVRPCCLQDPAPRCRFEVGVAGPGGTPGDRPE